MTDGQILREININWSWLRRTSKSKIFENFRAVNELVYD